jgi:hypothetical protein
MTEQEDFRATLSFATLEDDNVTVLPNGDRNFALKLPLSLSRKNAAQRQKTIENVLLNGCNSLRVDYVSTDNVQKIAKELVSLIYERARVTKNYVAPPAYPIIVNEYKNDYFEFLIDCAKRTVKEESALLRQIMYTILSSNTPDPINLGILAPTSTGKSYPLMQSVDYTPRGKEVRIVGSMTPKVLIREHGVLIDKEGKPIGTEVRQLRNAISEAKHKKNYKAAGEYQDELAALLDGSAYIVGLTNKTLIFLEPPHPELWNLLKPILSHDYWEMEHPYVEKLAGGGFEVKRVITRGFPAFIFCSAKDESRWEIWAEIESRLMTASPNMVKPKYQAGNKLIAQRKGLPRGVKQQVIISDELKELGKKCFLFLKHQIQQYTTTTDSPVWIPYTMLLADILPADRGQDNRVANRFYTMLNMIALSKAHLRHKLLFDDEELIIATLDDLREALHVMQNMTGLPPHKLKFYQQYILPLYHSKNGQPLQTRDICDFYNANSPKGTPPMNSNNLLKSYLYELANHNYLEQEQDDSTKAVRYLFTPLVDIEEEQEESERYTASTLSPVYHYLQFPRLLLPENHKGIPENWLNREILELSSHSLTNQPLKILDPKGNDMPIVDFIKHYEPENGPKLLDFFKVPRSVYRSNSANSTTSDPQKEGSDVNPTKKGQKENEKRYTQPKVDQVDGLDEELSKLINELMLDEHGNNLGYFDEGKWVVKFMLQPKQSRYCCDQDQALQMLKALIEEGKIVEFEPGKYRPTEEKQRQGVS